MNEWTTYRAECTECVFFNDGVCQMTEHRPRQTCPSFSLTPRAEALRYIKAKAHAERLGMVYDASGIILAGYSRATKNFVKILTRKGVME